MSSDLLAIALVLPVTELRTQLSDQAAALANRAQDALEGPRRTRAGG